MPLILDIHALQSLPPSLINRDDTGAPKSAVFGGVPRQRVSSQSWKRAIRRTFEEDFDPAMVGFRTKRVLDLVVDEIQEIGGEDVWPDDRAVSEASAVFKTLKIKLVDPKNAPEDDELDDDHRRELAKTGYLLFLSKQQIHNIAQAVVDADGEKIKKTDAKKLFNTDHSVDIAMFGRMVADDADYNVDASVQVAHAIGVHASEPEFDYFTAVDDLDEDEAETGAGMIGTVQMMSSTLYRYANVSLDSLAENLGDASAAVTAAEAFVDAFIKSMPTGKLNTFANQTLPELVYVAVRDTRPVSLVNAFEEPVVAEQDEGRRAVAARRLAAEEREIEQQYGFVPVAAFLIGLGDLRKPFEELDAEATTLPELGGQLHEVLVRELSLEDEAR